MIPITIVGVLLLSSLSSPSERLPLVLETGLLGPFSATALIYMIMHIRTHYQQIHDHENTPYTYQPQQQSVDSGGHKNTAHVVSSQEGVIVFR